MTADAGTSGQSLFRGALSLAITLAFIAFVEWYAGWAELLLPWGEVPAGALIAAAALLMLTHGMRALRVHDYFGPTVQGRRGACMRLVLQHNLFNNLLPMRSGELAFPVLMSRRFGIGPAVSLPGLLWFRLLDLHTLLLLAAPVLLASLPVATTVTVMLIWLALPWLGWQVLQRFAAKARALSGRFGRVLARLLDGFPGSHAVFWRTQAWTLANWILKLAVFAWVLLQFAPLATGAALLGAIGGEITSVLPIHGAGGFGTYEAGIVALTLPSGLEPAVLLRAAVNLHLFLLGVTLVAGGLAFLPRLRCVGSDGEAR